MSRTAALCVDVGSTYTKAAAVDLEDGRLYSASSSRTTVDGDVMEGLTAARDEAAAALPPAVEVAELRVCSSAGGGLRLGVVGNEALVTAAAAHRAGLSAGARVVHVSAGRIDDAEWSRLAESRPDVLLLAGGTDGGDREVVLEHAAGLARAAAREPALRVPVTAAVNSEAAEEAVRTLRDGGLTAEVVGNVLPRIGRLEPAPARAALREMFLRHVIAGKRLSDSTAFAGLVRAATPDAVLAGVELAAETGALGGELLVVDVGGATSDVYSALVPDAELSGPRREVAGHAWRSRTVEGDLGLRLTAEGVVAAAVEERLIDADEAAELTPSARRRAAEPGWLPLRPDEIAVDVRLTELAARTALRRHARGERLGGPEAPVRGGKDLRSVRLAVGSGGVLRAHGDAALEALRRAVEDRGGGLPLPESAGIAVDTSYVLAAAGLLAPDRPRAAERLLRGALAGEAARTAPRGRPTP